tara:strand:- start:1729 stop:2037 length:309 start_codon:yes stop_codon:yes gene_type:complete
MNESNNLPSAISHKKLSFLLLNAQKDKIINTNDINQNSEEYEKLLSELKDWELSTKTLLKKISKSNKNLLNEKSSESIMALGAMEVHLNMALQALQIFKKDN